MENQEKFIIVSTETHIIDNLFIISQKYEFGAEVHVFLDSVTAKKIAIDIIQTKF